MLRRPVHASAGTSVRWHVGPALPTPRPTAHVLRREGTHRRKCQLSALIEGAARAQPSRRATPSAAHGAMLPPQLPMPEPTIAYGFMSDSSSLAARTRHFQIAPVPRAVRLCARSDPRLPTLSLSYPPSVPRYPHKGHPSNHPPARRIRTFSNRVSASRRGDGCIRCDSDRSR